MSGSDRCADLGTTMATTPCVDLSIPSCPHGVREALDRVIAALGPLNLSADEVGTIELVLAEALNNVVEHAYGDQGALQPIRICAHHRADGLHLRITDRGKAMPGDQLPDGVLPDVGEETDALPEGGYGWYLIHDLANDVAYRREGDENRLDLRIAVADG